MNEKNIITLENEDKRPRIICMHCKTENIIDIRGWNTDVTQIGEIACKSCKKHMFVGLLIVANISIARLGQNIQEVIAAVGARNTLLQGEKEPKTLLDH